MKPNHACTSRHHPAAAGPLLANTDPNLVLLIAWPANDGVAEERELPITGWRPIPGPLPPGFPLLEPVTCWSTPLSYLDEIIFDTARDYGEHGDGEFNSRDAAIAYLAGRSLALAEEDTRALG